MPGDKSVPWVSSKVVHSQGREWYNWNFFHSTTPTQVIDQSQNSTVVHEWSQRSDRTSGGINDHVDKYKVSSNKPQKLKPCLACALTMIGYWEKIKEASGWQDDWTPGVWNAQAQAEMDGWSSSWLSATIMGWVMADRIATRPLAYWSTLVKCSSTYLFSF